MAGWSGWTSSAAAVACAASNGRISTAPYWPTMASAAILTIGNELLSGDVENTNGSWLARRLEPAGVDVRLIAVLPDEIEQIATTVREQAGRADLVLVTGGLGGTPDDLTREAVAAAFGVEQTEYADVAEELRARFRRDPEYAARWAGRPASSSRTSTSCRACRPRWRRCTRRSRMSCAPVRRSARGAGLTAQQ